MFNQFKTLKERRINNLFQFDEIFKNPELEKNSNIKNCVYISIKRYTYKAYALFHPAALVIRFKENPLKSVIFDHNYFTCFWN